MTLPPKNDKEKSLEAYINGADSSNNEAQNVTSFKSYNSKSVMEAPSINEQKVEALIRVTIPIKQENELFLIDQVHKYRMEKKIKTTKGELIDMLIDNWRKSLN